jgi:hypothetical protein
MLDFKGTAADVRDEVDARINEMFGTVDGALAMMEKQMASDPNFPNLIVPIPVFRKMVAGSPALGRQFMAELQRHKEELLDNARMAALWEAQWKRFRQALGEALGILSLTEDPAHTLMWSHYASEHFGIAVEFDENHAWFNQKASPADDIRHLVHVCYIQNPAPRTWQQLNGTDVLDTKNAEWSYEREWRIIRPLIDGIEVSPGKVCFDVPPEAVRCIIFGCRTRAALEQEIRADVAANPGLRHVRYKRARLADGGKIEVVDADA